MDTISFIRKANEIHNNRYDYSKSLYINTITKTAIVCHEHGVFYQAPKHHLRGSGCPRCSKNVLTRKEFIKKANKVHSNRYDYSSSVYVNSSTKLEILCQEHGSFWKSPGNHLKGQGCPKCTFISNDDFVKHAIKVHGNKYDYHKTNCKSKNGNVVVVCPEHGEFVTSYASHVKRGIGCSQCRNDRKTIEIISKFILVHGLEYDYSEVKYESSRCKVTIICKKHGRFRQSIFDHSNGQKCPKCSAENRRVSFDEFKNRANKKHANKYLYKSFSGLSNELEIICPIHGSFKQIANNHLRNGCPKCCANSVLTKEEFIERARKVHGNKYDYSKVKYVNYKSHITIICQKHGEFTQTPKVHLIGCGCQKCGLSRFHEEVYSYVSSIYDKRILINDRSSMPPKEIDIYLKDVKLGLECHGEWWHQDDPIRHADKAKSAHRININLFQIFYHEWLSKRNIIKSMIRNKLGLVDRIYARNCFMSVLQNAEYNKFMEHNHLQGSVPASVKYGLYHDGHLVASLSFKKHPKYQWEIARYTCNINTNVIGGFSKMLNRFLIDFKPNNIMTFADARFSSGNVYRKNGFKLIGLTNPNYFYYNNGSVLSRQKCQKHKLHKLIDNFDDNKTEYENMKNNGYVRVYDAGHYKFIYDTN